MATTTTNSKAAKTDQVYPRDTNKHVAVLDVSESGKAAKVSKVAALINAINAKTQEQSPHPKSLSLKRTASTGRIAAHSTEIGMGARINSSGCLLSDDYVMKPAQRYEIPNASDSECSDDECEETLRPCIRQMTRSLGRNEFMYLKAASHRPGAGDFSRAISDTSSEASLHGTNCRSPYSSPKQSPSRSALKEIPKGKVESNPFFQQDRRRGDGRSSQSPTKTVQDSDGPRRMSDSTRFVKSSTLGSRGGSVRDHINIKSRIQLWSEMEKQAKKQQRQLKTERRKSAHFPVSIDADDEITNGNGSLTLVSANDTVTTRKKSNSLSSLQVEIQAEEDSQTTVISTKPTSRDTFIEPKVNGNSLKVDEGSPQLSPKSSPKSSPRGSPKSSPRSSPKSSPKRGRKGSSSLDVKKGNLSRISSKLSPRFLRKKRDSASCDRDDKDIKIANRTNNKRRAFKTKSVGDTNQITGDSKSDGLLGLEDTSVQLRTSSMCEKPGDTVVITKRRAESQPIDPDHLLSLRSQTKKQASRPGVESTVQEKADSAFSSPVVILHSEDGRRQLEGADLHNGRMSSVDDASDPEVNADRTGSPGASSESSSDDGRTCPRQTSLDKQLSPTRTALKRRASDNMRSPVIGARKGSLTPYEDGADGLIATPLMCADAVWDRDSQETDELSFRVGDVIEILDMSDDVWWQGSVNDKVGWFPASFVRMRIGQESDNEEDVLVNTEPVSPESSPPPRKTVSESSDSTIQDVNRLSDSCFETPSESDSVPELLPSTGAPAIRKQSGNSVRRRMTIRRKDSAPSLPRKLTPTEVRSKVVEEILNTERDYVHNLENIIEGFLNRCREYNTLFDTERVETIFANVEEIYRFQRDFLRELESKVDRDRMDCSEIGNVFVINKHEFAIYSQYCNNHPHAVNEMNLLQQNEQYALFFESCRLLRNLQDISLEGFLLTPVQKICKYPLQLSELLKYTDKTHPDYDHVVAAQQAMKEVAMHINEQKRRMENIGKIGLWQLTIDGWKGADILEKSSELIHSGELHKISKGHSQERHFFLFDQQLVYCKKEIGGKLSYKGRLDMGECQVIDVDDTSVLHGNTYVKNAWRMQNKNKDKWYIIYAKTAEVKKEWMEAFEQERTRVQEDIDKGFHVTMKMKRAAVSLVETSTESVRRRKSFSKRHILFTESVDGGARPTRNRLESSSSGKKLAVSVLTSSTQPSRKQKGNKKKS